MPAVSSATAARGKLTSSRLVPYELLTDAERQQARHSAREVLRAITVLGYVSKWPVAVWLMLYAHAMV